MASTDRRRFAPGPPDDLRDSGRERVSRAAYELFSREGVRAVGVDAVIARAGTAFGPYGEGFLRFSYANSVENIRAALEAIRAQLS